MVKKSKKGKTDTSTTQPDPNQVERITLSNIVYGFNQQAMGIPGATIRLLEMDGFAKDHVPGAVKIYKDIMDEMMDGKNLMTCQLAAYYVLAEITTQINMAATASAQVTTKPNPTPLDQIMYG